MILAAKDLSYGTPPPRPKVLALGLSFELRSGEVLRVRGPNGSGKSTLLRVLLGMQRPLSGHLDLRVPLDLTALVPQLQSLGLHLPMTLKDVLRIALPEENLNERVLQTGLLEESHLRLQWNTASGGEKKRTLLARALLREPALLLLDEPMNHLDALSRARVAQALKDYIEGGARRAIVLITHEGESENALAHLPSRELDLGGITE